MFAARIRLRSRMLVGVTSTSSSSLMNSIACSRPSLRGGIRRIASSADEARMLVCFFSLRDVDVHVRRARVLADQHAFVDLGRRVDEDLAALLQVEDRVRRRHARPVGHQRAVGRDGMAPCHGSQLEKMWFMMPVPLVSVMNCDRKPMRPRAGMRNSSRTRPLPWLTIFVITPLRSPTCAMTMP